MLPAGAPSGAGARGGAESAAPSAVAPRSKSSLTGASPPAISSRPKGRAWVTMSRRLMPAPLRMAFDIAAFGGLSLPPPAGCRCAAAAGSSRRTPCMILAAIDLPELFGPMNTLSLWRPIAARSIGPTFSSLISSNFMPPGCEGA